MKISAVIEGGLLLFNEVARTNKAEEFFVLMIGHQEEIQSKCWAKD